MISDQQGKNISKKKSKNITALGIIKASDPVKTWTGEKQKEKKYQMTTQKLKGQNKSTPMSIIHQMEVRNLFDIAWPFPKEPNPFANGFNLA